MGNTNRGVYCRKNSHHHNPNVIDIDAPCGRVESTHSSNYPVYDNINVGDPCEIVYDQNFEGRYMCIPNIMLGVPAQGPCHVEEMPINYGGAKSKDMDGGQKYLDGLKTTEACAQI